MQQVEELRVHGRYRRFGRLHASLHAWMCACARPESGVVLWRQEERCLAEICRIGHTVVSVTCTRRGRYLRGTTPFFLDRWYVLPSYHTIHTTLAIAYW